jgi:dihydroneopterin aldolase
MQGTIFIEDFILHCSIGITEKEKAAVQEIVVNIFLTVDPEKAVHTDDIADTVSYSIIHSQIGELVKKSRFNLLETLASKIADICLQDSHVKKVKVSVKKPQRYSDVKAVGVVIEKNKI